MTIQPRIQIFDIETLDSVDTTKAPEPIPCMTFYDTMTNTYHIFCHGFKKHELAMVSLRLQHHWQINLIPKLLKYNFSNPILVFHSQETEKQMLGDLLSFINNNRPDIIAPWNRKFDMPYIVQRMKNLNLPYNALSEVQKVYYNTKNETITIQGTTECDLMEHYIYSLPQAQRSTSLDFCANKEFGVGKMKRVSIKEMRMKDPVGLLAYNIVDVQLSYALMDTCQLITNMQTIERISNAGLDNQSPLRIIDSFIMTSLRNRKTAVPTNTYKKRDEKKEGGAFVHSASIGKHNNTLVLDFKSYYTSVMMDGNVCASTNITLNEIKQISQLPDNEIQEYIHKNYIHCPNGALFRKDKIGVIPEILVHVREERNRHKKLMKNAKDEQEKGVEDRLQNGFKRIGNISYGQFKNPHFRLMDKAIAEAITSICKLLTITVIDILEKTNVQDLLSKFKSEIPENVFNQIYPRLNILLKIIYGDTDSLMIKLPDTLSGSELRIVGKIIEKYVNSLLPSLTKDLFNIDRKYIEIEFDDKKIMKSFIQMPKQGDRTEGAKKRYIYLSYNDDNTLNPEPHFVGVDVIRSDTSPLMVEVQTKLARMILNDEPYSNIRKYLLDLYNTFNKQSPDLLLIKETLHQFDNIKSNSPQVVGALYANKYMQKSFKSGSTVYYLYLKSLPTGYPRMETNNLKALCLDYNESVPKNFFEHIDWEKMKDIVLIKPTETILDAVGYKWSEIVTGTKENKVSVIKVTTFL